MLLAVLFLGCQAPPEPAVEAVLTAPAPAQGEFVGVFDADLFPLAEGVAVVGTGRQWAGVRRWSAGQWAEVDAGELASGDVATLGPGGGLAFCRPGVCSEHEASWGWSKTANEFFQHGESAGPLRAVATTVTAQGHLVVAQPGGRAGRNLYVWDGASERPLGPGFGGTLGAEDPKAVALAAVLEDRFAVAELFRSSLHLAVWDGEWRSFPMDTDAWASTRDAPFGPDADGRVANRHEHSRDRGESVAVALDGARPVVGWTTGDDLRVRRYTDVDAFEDLPSPVTGPGVPRDLALAVHEGSVVVAWSQAVIGEQTGPRGIHVRRYDGASWVPLGPAGAAGIVESALDANAPTLAVDGAGSLFAGWVMKHSPYEAGVFVASQWMDGSWEPLGWEPRAGRATASHVRVVRRGEVVAMGWAEAPRVFPQQTFPLEVRVRREGTWTTLTADLPWPWPDELHLTLDAQDRVTVYARRLKAHLGYAVRLEEREGRLVSNPEGWPSGVPDRSKPVSIVTEVIPAPDRALRVLSSTRIERWSGSDWVSAGADLCRGDGSWRAVGIAEADGGQVLVAMRGGRGPEVQVAGCLTGGDGRPSLTGALDAAGFIGFQWVEGAVVGVGSTRAAGSLQLQARTWDPSASVWGPPITLATCAAGCGDPSLSVDGTRLCAGWLEPRLGGQEPGLACVDFDGGA